MTPPVTVTVPTPRFGRLGGGTCVAAVALSVAAGAAVVHLVTGRFWGDLAVYRTGAAAAAAGDGGLYEVTFRGVDGVALGFTYPPFAALLFQPLRYVDLTVAVAVWTLASVLALLAAIGVTLRAAGVPARRRTVPTLLAGIAALPMFPVAGHLQVGQVGMFLMLAVLLDLTGDPRRRGAGLAVGIAAGIKLTPLIFVVYLAATGRLRAAGVAVGGFLGTVGIGFLWRPADSVRFWSGTLLDASRVAEDPRTVLNQSLSGALVRLSGSTDPWYGWLPVLLVALAGLAVAAWCARIGEELPGVLACATTGLLVSPVSWHHHWVWWVPVLVLGVVWAGRAGDRWGFVLAGGVWLGFVSSTGWAVGADPPGRLWDVGYANLYVLFGLALLGCLPVLLRRRRAASTPSPPRPFRPAPPEPVRPAPPNQPPGETPLAPRNDTLPAPTPAPKVPAVRVSVIVPNYNKEKTLAACLTAVHAQTVAPAEVIVVDDASTDRSREIVSGFPCLLVPFPTNRGVSAARNAGAARATCDVLFFVDSDIALAPDALANALRVLREHPDCGVVQGVYDLHPLFPDGPVEAYKTLFEHFWRSRAAGETSTTMFALTALPRVVFDTVGGFDESLRDAEDVEFGTRLPASYRIRTSAEVVGRHDDVDRLWPYLSELFRRARTYAGAVVLARWAPPVVPRAEAPRRPPHRIDLGVLAGMAGSVLAVGTLPLAAAGRWLWMVPLGLFTVFLVADRALLWFALRRRGPLFLLYATVLRWLTHLTEFVGLLVGVARALTARNRRAGARAASAGHHR
ncbi:glycosyltransferase 87 family protein [Plantactinospora sonchi]|uniref:Glycosyltransferase 87 family protein n=1 Tax=Plantactinospora sonchi TaxID=1544735 RepID=A0ABU7S0V4_9ACTN